MIDRALMKREAKLSMRGRKPSVYLVTLVYIIIVDVLAVLSFRVENGIGVMEYYNLLMEYGMDGLYNMPVSEPSFFGSILAIAISVMSTVLAAGYLYFSMRVSRGQQAGFGELFDGFGLFFKIWGLSIVMSLFIMLWSLLLVIPGIIASYRYSMALFILLDDPDKPIMECIRESKEITNGYKMELFVLELSFIGWNLLALIPFVGLFVTPYYEVTRAKFYNALSGWTPDVVEADYTVKEPWEM